MAARVTRAERTELVRTEVLAAARTEFLSAGYHGATLDRIAAAAGYTKGAVYSRYESKADLFLALLEQRIDDRAEQNRRMAKGRSGPEALLELTEEWARVQRRDLDWTLLVLEFRIHAARHPELQARYAELHRRTLDAITEVFETVLGPDAVADGVEPRDIAQAVFSAGNGAALEHAVDPAAMPPSVLARILLGLIGTEAAA